MKHFYGIPVSYNNQTKALLIEEFMQGLLLQTQNPIQHDPASSSVSLFPSWSWTASKAAQPSGASLLTFDFCNSLPEDIAVSIEHHSGEEMDLLEFMTTYRTALYIEFRPILGISTWVFSSRIAAKTYHDERPSQEFIGIPTSTVSLDKYPGGYGMAIALYMGFQVAGFKRIDRDTPDSKIFLNKYEVCFLLVREIELNCFRRIGQMYATFYNVAGWTNVPLTEVTKLMDARANIKWGRRKMRLV
jgi:hypothetical protein